VLHRDPLNAGVEPRMQPKQIVLDLADDLQSIFGHPFDDRDDGIADHLRHDLEIVCHPLDCHVHIGRIFDNKLYPICMVGH